MTEINWTIILQIVIAGGIVWILKGVSAINGSVREIKAWQVGHKELNDLQWGETKDKFEILFADLNKEKP